MRKIISFFVFSLFVVSLFYSCGSKSKDKDTVYPKYHYVSIYKSPELNANERIEYLMWGTMLEVEDDGAYVKTNVSKDEKITNVIFSKKGFISITNISADQKKTNVINSYRVFNPLSKMRGYVDEKDVIKNPLMKGVIIKTTSAANTPNLGSLRKKILNPFIPVYFISISEDKEFYQVIGYISKNYVLPEEEEKVTPMWEPLWVYKTDVSTNKNDADMIVLCQLSINRYKNTLAQYEKDPEKNAKNYTNVIEREANDIRIALDKYRGLNSEVLEYVMSYKYKLEDILTGGSSTSSNNEEVESAEYPEEEYEE